MHITLETDYAIRIVDCLGSHSRRMGAQEIAQKTRVTLRFSLKILRKLVASGIIRSFKGAQGGYEIAKPLDQVSVGDIIETIEGPYLLNRCLVADHPCQQECEICPYRELFAEISHGVNKHLHSMTMDKLVGKKIY